MMLKGYEEYKQANLPWLKQVPKHWEWFRNKNIFIEKKETVGDRKKDFDLLSLTKNGVIIRDISSGKGKFPKDFDSYKIVQKGDMIFCLFDVDETPRTVGLSEHEGMITGAYDVFKVQNINSQYIYYYYKALDNVKAFKPLYTGLRKVIPLPAFMATRIPVPLPEEQDQIVKFLDWKVSEMNRFIREKRKQVKRLEELKYTQIDKLVTKGIAQTDFKESGVEWLGQVPSHWDIDHIKQHFKIKKRIAGREGYDVLSITQQGIKVKDIESNEGQMAQNYANYQFVYPGDFAMNHMDLLTGYVDLSDKFGVTSPDYRVFTLDDTESCCAEFYLRVFQIGYKRKIFYKFGKGAANQGRWRMPKDAFYNYAIQVPPIKEQIAITEECDRVEKQINKMIAGIQQEISLVEELRIKIISDVVTGQIDVRDVVVPKYEQVFENEDDSEEQGLDESSEELEAEE